MPIRPLESAFELLICDMVPAKLWYITYHIEVLAGHCLVKQLEAYVVVLLPITSSCLVVLLKTII